MQKKKKKKKNPPKIWERKREINFFCEEKLCIWWKRECQIYTKRMIIRRNKMSTIIRKIKRKMKGDIKIKGCGEMKM